MFVQVGIQKLGNPPPALPIIRLKVNQKVDKIEKGSINERNSIWAEEHGNLLHFLDFKTQPIGTAD